jgi:hypothetical protein
VKSTSRWALELDNSRSLNLYFLIEQKSGSASLVFSGQHILNTKRVVRSLYIIASFQHSKDIEIAVADIANMGLNKSNILVLPLDNRASLPHTFDTKYHSDRESLIDIAAILGMIFMLLGAIYGFVLEWGPILWGLIGLVFGIIIGFSIKYFHIKSKQTTNQKTIINQTEIVLIVNCENYQEDKIKNILWQNYAIGLTTFNNYIQSH